MKKLIFFYVLIFLAPIILSCAANKKHKECLQKAENCLIKSLSDYGTPINDENDARLTLWEFGELRKSCGLIEKDEKIWCGE